MKIYKKIIFAIFVNLLVSNVVFSQQFPVVNHREAEKWREDLRYMAQEMPKRHKNLFHTISREQFETAVRKLDEKIPTLARHQIIVEMMRIAAMIGMRDGHTSLNPFFNPKMEFHSLPVEFYMFKDGLFVRAAEKQFAEIVGGRVMKIGNASAEQAYKKVSEVVSQDNAMTLKQRVPKFLTISEVLHASGLIDDLGKVQLVVEKNGKQTTVEIKPPGNLKQRDFQGQEQPGSKQDWIKMDSDAQKPLPLWLKTPEDNYWFEYLEDSNTVYVQYNKVFNKEGESIAAFSNRLFEFVENNPVERFVLDIRGNEGGNGFFNMPLLLGIIKSEKINRRGHFFTIIGRGTFSAAQVLANELDRYTNTIFVGEPTGGSVHFYGDHALIELPNSKLNVAVSPTYWQTLNPNDNRLWIAPQVLTELASEDYRTNNDPAFNAILNYKSIVEVIMPALSADNLESAIKQYRDFKSDPKTSPINTESDINSLGYHLLRSNKLGQAIEIFKLNVESYPNSANVYDSLADAYLQKGDKEQAIKNYEKALELNPHNAFTTEKLRKLRQDKQKIQD